MNESKKSFQISQKQDNQGNIAINNISNAISLKNPRSK